MHRSLREVYLRKACSALKGPCFLPAKLLRDRRVAHLQGDGRKAGTSSDSAWAMGMGNKSLELGTRPETELQGCAACLV